MPPAKKPPLDLSAGSILHIRGFQNNSGFAPKNKYLISVGWHSTHVILAFRITSQNLYTQTNLARELVHIPSGTVGCLTKHSYIQCFHDVERLDIGQLQAGWVANNVTTVGKHAACIATIHGVVQISDVLSPQDIADVLAATPNAPPPQPPPPPAGP